MRDIQYYIDEAKQKSGVKSERQLSRMLGLSGHASNQWKTQGKFPSDDTMVRLAKIAKVPPEQALLDLNMWRSHGMSKSFYAKIAKLVERAAVTTAAITLLIFPAFSANASQVVHESNATIYYGK